MSRRKFQIKLPLRMKVNKAGDQESLNLNVFRNLHFYKLNHQKKAFQHFVKPLLSGIPLLDQVTLEYELNPKGGHRLDLMNVGSIVDKFFSDALVENGIIPDDDYKHLGKATFSFGRLCPEDPHVLVTIIETISRKGTPMRILLDQEEIRQALEAFIKTMGLPGAAGVELTVNDLGEVEAEILTNLRSVKASTNAESDSDEDDKNQSVNSTGESQSRKRGGRVPGSKNKPKADTNVQAPTSSGSTGSAQGAGDRATGSNSLFPEDGDESDENEGLEVGELDLSGDSFDSSDEERGDEEEEDDLFKTNRSSPRGNLSGDSASGSFEKPTTENDDGSDEEETSPTPVKSNRPSIFDAD